MYHDRNTMRLFQWLECVEHCLCQFYDNPPLDMCITLAIFFMVVSILDSVLSISCPNSSNMLNKLKQGYITYNNIYDQEQCVFLFVISFIPRNKMTAWLPLGCCWNKVHWLGFNQILFEGRTQFTASLRYVDKPSLLP